MGRYTQNLVENLLKLDKKNYYILLFNTKDIGSKIIVKAKNKSIVYNKTAHYSLKEQTNLPLILNKQSFDFAHFPHFNVPIFFKSKFMVTIHDLIKHYSKGLDTTTKSPFLYLIKYIGYKLVFKNAVEKAKKIIVPSKWILKQLRDEYPNVFNKTKVIYEGIDDKFKNLKGIKLEIKSKPYILYVGNAYPHKNLRRLILAVKFLNKKETDKINLVIVGARDIFWQRLKKEISDLKAASFVNLPGYISDRQLKYLYQNSLCYINSSLMEGFGLPGLEAMELNCPVLCSNIPVFKEIYGNGALYFDPENVEDIKDKIIQLLNLTKNDKNLLIKNAKNQVGRYSWQKCAEESLKVYESL